MKTVESLSCSKISKQKSKKVTEMPTTACMSLHQPYASLLVYGHHCAEGRTWNSDFRGKLWIHAAAKEYPKEESDAIVKDHLERFQNAGYEPPPVPQTYPRSALIGRVEVIDIVTCEELQERVEKEDLPAYYISYSPFVFICKNFERLLLPISRSGHHKIWHLEKDLAKRAERALREVPSCRRMSCSEEKKSKMSISIEEFRSRNKTLRIRLERALNEDTFKTFKSLSSKYRDKTITPEDYVRTAFERIKVSKELLREVIVLLPKSDSTRQRRALGVLDKL